MRTAARRQPQAGGTTARHRAVAAPLTGVRVRVVGRLAEPVAKTAAVRLSDGRLVVAGGLVGGSSTDHVWIGSPGTSLHLLGHLPTRLHDAAMVALPGDHVFHLGGGNTVQDAGVRRIDVTTGTIRQVARLPRPASDLGAVVIADAAYAIGGFDGVRWLDTVSRFTAGHTRPVVVAHLPAAVRYAAIGSLDGAIYVAGGTRSSDTDARDVWRIDPATGAVRTLQPLPRAGAHAVFALVGGHLVLAGGRTGTSGANELRSFDPVTGATKLIGHLPTELADPAVVDEPNGRALLVGGGARGGAASDLILELSAR